MASRGAIWNPHVSERDGEDWPMRIQHWTGWLSHSEYNLIDLALRSGIGDFEILSEWTDRSIDHSRKLVNRMLESGLATGNLREYVITLNGKRLFLQTERYILAMETGELTSVVVIGDIHARWNKFKELMRKIGAMDENGNRMGGFQFIQLGDAVSLGYGEQEADFYKWFMDEWMGENDHTLIGNHELPAIFTNYNVEFLGWEDRDRACEELVKKYWKEGRLKAAHHYNNYLLTHAGLSSKHMEKLNIQSAEEASALLNMELYERVELGLNGSYSTDFIVGVDSQFGGIFWVRPNAYSWKDYPNEVHQMFGHTPAGPMDVGQAIIKTSSKSISPTDNLRIPGLLTLLDTKPSPNIASLRLRNPSRDIFGGVACAMFEHGDGDPKIYQVEASHFDDVVM